MADQGMWFKLWIGADDDPDLGNLSLQDFGRWCKFGLYLKKHGTGGVICLKPPCIPLQQKLQLDSFDAVICCINKFPNCTVTVETVATVTWRNWLRYQGDNSTGRVRQYRQRETAKKRREEMRRDEKRDPKKEGEAPSPVKYEKGKEPWRPVANRIYKQDTERFKRIAAFINWCRHEDQNYTDEIIAKGFEKFERALKDRLCDGDWWPYAEKLFKKAYTEDQQAQSAKHKDESARFVAHALKLAGK